MGARIAYEPQGPFTQSPGAGLARILQPASRVWRETGRLSWRPFSAYMPHAQALEWARQLAEQYGEPFRVLACGDVEGA